MTNPHKAKTELYYEGYRVEVTATLAGSTHEEQVKAVTDIAKQIERHVDNATVAVHFHTLERCAYCKTPVDLGYVGLAPACCEEAIMEVAEGHKKAL